VSESPASAGAIRSPRGGELPAAVGRLLFTRVRQSAFWRVQAAIAAVTALHYATAAVLANPPLAEFRHLPVALYVFPIIYASLRFGREGGMMTAATLAVFAVPSIAIWHLSWAAATAEIVQLAAAALVGCRTLRERGARADAARVRGAARAPAARCQPADHPRPGGRAAADLARGCTTTPSSASSISVTRSTW